MAFAKWFVVAGVLAMSATAEASPVAVSDFDVGLVGWVGGGGNASLTYVASGGIGNSGFAKTTDVASGQMTLVSPALGNLSGTLGGSFSFDYDVFSLGAGNRFVPNNAFGLVTINSGGLHVSADLIPNVSVAGNLVGTGWHLASIGLLNSAWSGNATLAQVLANVTSLSIDTEYDQTQRWPDEVVGIDSVAFKATPSITARAAVPEPATGALLLLGLAGLVVRVHGADRGRRRYLIA